jgi:hypothetical protein
MNNNTGNQMGVNGGTDDRGTVKTNGTNSSRKHGRAHRQQTKQTSGSTGVNGNVDANTNAGANGTGSIGSQGTNNANPPGSLKATN